MDRRGELTGQKVQDYFNSINVEHWTSHNDEMKANYAECIIQIIEKVNLDNLNVYLDTLDT